MNDENNSLAEEKPSETGPGTDDTEIVGRKERIFDISPDFNISPVEEGAPIATEPAQEVTKVTKSPEVKQPAQLQQSSETEQPASPQQPLETEQPAQSPPPSQVESEKQYQPLKNKALDGLEIPHDPNYKPLRTYESDIAEALARKRTSTTDIVIAESRKKEGNDSIKTKVDSNANKKMIIVVISLILVIAGLGGGYYLYLRSPLAPGETVPEIAIVPSLMPTDSEVTLAIDDESSLQIQRKIQDEFIESQSPGTLREIVPTIVMDNKVLRLPAAEMLRRMEIDPPDALTRSLTSLWMMGVHADKSGEKNLFIIVTTNFFQNTFAGMLSWEQVMADDLKAYLYPEQTDQYFTVRGKFVDKLVKNRDVRAYQADDGKILFIYSFIDNTRLVITGSESTLEELIARLEKQAFIR